MTPFTRLILGLAGTCLSWAGPLGGLPARIHEFQLGNGMRFIVLERHHSPQVAAWMYVRAGEMDERDGQRGAAGLMDNVFLMGTESIGSKSPPSEKVALAAVEQAMDRLETEMKRAGGEFSLARERAQTELKIALDQARQWESPVFNHILVTNGLSRAKLDTGMDSSRIGWTLPSERAEVWFKLLGEWLHKPSFRGFYRARDSEAAKENPAGAAAGAEGWMTLLRREAFPDSPYSRPAGLEAMGNLRAAAAEQYFRGNYQPSRIAMALVGDITPIQARQWAERYFGSLPAQPKAETANPARVKTGEYRQVVNSMLSAVGYRRPPQGHSDDLYFDLLAKLLTGGSSPYYLTEMKTERQVAQNTLVIGNFPGDRLESLLLLVAVPAPGRTTAQLEVATIAIAEKFAAQPLEAPRLTAAVNRMQMELLLALQSNESAAAELARVAGAGETVRGVEQQLERLQRVTPEEFQKFARQYLNAENRFVFAMSPAVKEKTPRPGGPQ